MNEQDRTSWLRNISEAGDPKTPFILTDLSVAVQKVNEFREQLPRVKIYYAVKSNSDPRLIQTLKPLVAGFDIASLGELRLLQKLGVNSTRVIFSNPVKAPTHIRDTYKAGVTYFALDSDCEIDKLRKYAPGAIIYLRVTVSDLGSKFPLSSKFGLSPAQVPDFAAKAQKAGLKVKGLAFHVGSQSETVDVWRDALQLAGSLIEQCKDAGVKIDFLDIGGGFPAQYTADDPTINAVAETINRALDEYIPSDTTILAEPGRYISANTSVIGTTIIGRERRLGRDWLYLDMGVFQGLIEPLEMTGWKYPILTYKPHPSTLTKFVLTGPTCDAYDTIGTDYLLPSNLRVGDKIYIAASGAYSVVYGSNFNGFATPSAHYVQPRAALTVSSAKRETARI